jgi:predicted RNase H-like nuclease (RuvC/YqgF family)
MDTFKLYNDLSQSLSPDAARVLARVLGDMYQELRQSVTQSDFAELKSALGELAQAQGRTEQRVEELAQAQGRTEQRVEELAQAQGRTEQRVEELAQAQGRTEQRVEELAQAQARSEGRLDRVEAAIERLTQAQARSEGRLDRVEAAIERLTRAQERTEEEVRSLARGLKETREMVGGLSDAVGYGLENRAMTQLPALLQAEHGIAVEGRLVRRFVEYPDGGLDEVNILGEGRRGETRLSVVGEAKARLGRRDVDRFLKLVQRLQDHGLLQSDRFLLVVSHSVRPDVERYARGKGLVVIPSYLLEGG